MNATLDADIARLKRVNPALFQAPITQRLRTWGLWLVFLAATLFSLWWIDASPARILSGLDKLGLMVRLMIPPLPGDSFWDFCRAMLETLAMAFLGTVIAALLAVPLGFLGAKNIVPNWLFHFSLRRFFDAFRGIDGLVWALIFVSAVGLGPFAGVLAIAMGDVMVLGKLFAEAIENVDKKPVEGVRASGGGGLHVVSLGVLPQVFPVMMSHVLYFFESNVRSATILGIVGAGGIGLALSDRMRINNWQEAAFIILMILLTVAIIDAISRRIRARLT
ncbi:MAG: phosphonate ABC transporter, permease protein PhnE [Pelagibacterium sp. SCN 63-23]|nr:MAG: phosphonate ABC transporter, permease protein PhnE [Pelagibacterium sp. SCN 63-23]